MTGNLTGKETTKQGRNMQGNTGAYRYYRYYFLFIYFFPKNIHKLIFHDMIYSNCQICLIEYVLSFKHIYNDHVRSMTRNGSRHVCLQFKDSDLLDLHHINFHFSRIRLHKSKWPMNWEKIEKRLDRFI